MDDYAGRVLADRYRLPVTAVADEPLETPAFDTYSGQEVRARQVPLPEVVSAEVVVGPGDEEPPDVLGPDDDPGQRALRAASAAARLPDHPRLVQVYDVFLEGGCLWIISERVPAKPLSALVAEGPLTPYRAAEIGADILAALRAVHARGWAHRNVTADTVLIADDGRAMLTGLAAAAAEEAICGNDPVPPAGSGQAGEALDAPGDLAAARSRPANPTARQRARDTRFDIVGAVTERWAPEQAGPLRIELPVPSGLPEWAEPVDVAEEELEDGPSSDMWALGALLLRCVTGRPAFPEHSPRELAELVRTEPPAYGEECGPLRPIVEALMRKDPRTRPAPEEVRDWLRALIRTAPEPDIGRETVPVPADDHKVVEVRRRGEVARRRQGALAPRGRHARAKSRRRSPRRLGLLLVGSLFLLMVLAMAAVVLVAPGKEDNGSGRPSAAGGPGGEPAPAPTGGQDDLSTDVSLYQDPAGFQLSLHDDLRHKGTAPDGRVLFEDDDDVVMIVSPGLDTVAKAGPDLARYQKEVEPELKEYREARESTATGLDRIEINGYQAIKGEFTWRDADNQEFFARNLVILHKGAYHVVLVKGPRRDRQAVSQFFEKAAGSYRITK